MGSSVVRLDWEIISFMFIEVFDSPPKSNRKDQSDKKSHEPYPLFIYRSISQG